MGGQRVESRTDEIADGVFRISTFAPEIGRPAGFTFNQFLVLGDGPLLFHTGLRRMFPLVLAAVERVIPPQRLRWISFVITRRTSAAR
jgi:flavorubredoxin